MSIESDADRLAFFDPGEFGVAAVWTPAAGGASHALAGILLKPWVEAGGNGPFVGVSSAGEILFSCRERDVAGLVLDDHLTVSPADGSGAVAYAVRVIRPDGSGCVRLVLEEI